MLGAGSYTSLVSCKLLQSQKMVRSLIFIERAISKLQRIRNDRKRKETRGDTDGTVP